MSIRFACTCGKKMKASEDQVGRRILCSNCGNPVTVPEGDSGGAASAAGTSSSASAADMMKAVAESDKKSRKARVKEKDEEGVDLAESAKVLFLQFAPGVGAVVFIAVLTYWLSAAMFTTEPELPPLEEVSGVVVLDGKPLEGALVTFQPMAGMEAGSEVASSTGSTDSHGRYELYYRSDVKGAAVGKHSVQIQKRDKMGQNVVPPRYNSATELVREVKEGQDEPIDFNLKSGQ